MSALYPRPERRGFTADGKNTKNMLRITTLKGNVSATAKTYYSKEDNYYNKEATTQWHGSLANDLGLTGEVDSKVFEKLLIGELPNGQKLITNTKAKNSEHRMGYDLTFSAPKSISIQGLIGNDLSIVKAHDEAVKIALNELEKHIMVRKKIKGISQRENSANFLVAMFRHELSRSLDPQIHTHAIVMNFTKRADGELRAISNESIFKIIKQTDAIYKNELLKQVQKLGYEIRHTGKNGDFELAHITRQQIEAFSKRTSQIQEQAIATRGKEYDALSVKEQRIISEKSRDKKVKTDHTELRQKWDKQALESNLNLKIDLSVNANKNQTQIKALEAKNIEPTLEMGLEQEKAIFKILNWAIKHHIEREATLKKSDILVSAIHQSQGKLTYTEIQSHIEKLIEKGELIESTKLYTNYSADNQEYKSKKEYIDAIIEQNKISAEKAEHYFTEGVKNGRIVQKDSVLTTPQAIANDRKILELEQSTRNILEAISKDINLDATKLNDSQKQAVITMLTSTNRYVAIQGDAGVGKSFALKNAIEKMELAKYNVQVLAPYAKQVSSLKDDGLNNSKTLAAFLADRKRLIDRNSIVVLDEAGIVSSKQMLALMNIVEKSNSRLILIGDTKQTQAIEAGKPFYELQKNGIQTTNITEIQRQKDAELKAIVEDIANDKIVDSYEKLLNKDNSILEIKKDEERYIAIAKEYSDDVIKNEDVILVVGENETRKKLNTLIRRNLGLANNGVEIEILKNIDMTTAEKQDIKAYEQGNYIKIDNTIYEIQSVDIASKILVLSQSNTNTTNQNKEHISINLDTTDTSYIQTYSKQNIEISTGELIKFTQNNKSKNIANNDEFIVVEIQTNLVMLECKKSKKRIAIDKQELKHIDYAYTKTIHASQGMTANKTILELDYRSATTSKNVYYVGVSRAKNHVKIYTNNIVQTKKSVQKEQQKSSSLDVSKNIINQFL
jgi:conjugative relaxase-like TrwC/TraI family protein